MLPVEESRERTGGRVARSEKKKYTVIKLKGKESTRWMRKMATGRERLSSCPHIRGYFFGSLVKQKK